MKPQKEIILAVLFLLVLAVLFATFIELSYSEDLRTMPKEQLNSLSRDLLGQIIQADGILIGFTGVVLSLTPKKNPPKINVGSFIGLITIFLFLLSLIAALFGYIRIDMRPIFAIPIYKLPFTWAISFLIDGAISMLLFLVLVRGK